MGSKTIQRPIAIPTLLQRRSTDEYVAPPYSGLERYVVSRIKNEGVDSARRAVRPLGDYWASRLGTASALRALNDAWGHNFYKVPAEATVDQEIADAALGGNELVIDVQVHFMGDSREQSDFAVRVKEYMQTVATDRFKGMDSVTGYNLSEFIRCVYLESETAVAILTSSPGDISNNYLPNLEIAGTRELIDRMAGTGRLLNHTIIHPNAPGDLDQMEAFRDKYDPCGWKLYTMHGEENWLGGHRGWMLDDEDCGMPFLERTQKMGVNLICVHKGVSGLAPTGSPEDVGPAAKAFPGIEFLVYHSGYEIPTGPDEEGPYSDDVSHLGSNRLVKSLIDAGIKPGSNVYAELGSTWFLTVKRPREAAHVLGKLLLAVGEDNVLWGTDSIWYDSPQPEIDAFRTFEIPEDYQEKYGYPSLTPALKEKILGLNAARVYNIDIAKARQAAATDDLAWAKAAIEEYKVKGMPSVK